MTKVLDHGYVEYVGHLGSDELIVESARMSTDGAFRGWAGPCKDCDGAGGGYAFAFGGMREVTCAKCDGKGYRETGDEKLLEYMYSNDHSSPFEFGHLIVEVQCPMPIGEQWLRHRTQSFSKLSGRYVEMPELFHVPAINRVRVQSKTNRQAGDLPINESLAIQFQDGLNRAYQTSLEVYREALGMGVAKEQARMALPAGQYTRFRASANLRNWLLFLGLRLHDHAQWEMRQYAEAVAEIIKDKWPRTYALFEEWTLYGSRLSRTELADIPKEYLPKRLGGTR